MIPAKKLYCFENWKSQMWWHIWPTTSMACWPMSSVNWLCIMALFPLSLLTEQSKCIPSEPLAPDTWKLRESSIHCLAQRFSRFVWKEAMLKYLEKTEGSKDPKDGERFTLSLLKCFFPLRAPIKHPCISKALRPLSCTIILDYITWLA